MPKDPAFLFYYQDWLVGTYFLNRQEKGAYMDLLCYQADKGKLTIEIIEEVLGKDFACWEKIRDKFIEENGVFYNKRLKEEREKRARYSESRRKNRSKICETYDKHMENENEDVNILKKKENIFKKEIAQFKNYPTSMLREFGEYWTEPNKSGTKLRFELEKTWDTKRRLERWASNSTLKAPKSKKMPDEVRTGKPMTQKQIMDYKEKHGKYPGQ